MKILMASTEMAPLARTGGLGDVLDALPAELQKRGHDVTVVLPLYRAIRENPSLKIESTGVELSVYVGSKCLDAEIYQATAPNGVQIFLVRRDEYFDRSGIYGIESGRSYDDNAERFTYFSRAVVELARHMKPAPDVIHAHDWQTALVPAFVRERGLPFGTVLTVHNLAYQGSFWGLDFGLTNLPGHFFSQHGLEFHGRMNFLKGGIAYADVVTTVSERYARDIQTPEHGCGLDGVLRANAHKLVGILNGADYKTWNPATDTLTPAKYTEKKTDGKKKCRNGLLEDLGLSANPKGPVLAMVTRLSEQKGVNLLIPILDRVLADDVRLIVVGEGDLPFERELMVAARKYPGKFTFQKGLDDRLLHRIYAGADAVIVPPHFEPSGLSAMYALKYGTLPIARISGGLHQIIQDYDPTTETGNGFVYFEESPVALWDTIGRAKRLFKDKDVWATLVREAMLADFSWPAAAASYERIFESVSGHRALARIA